VGLVPLSRETDAGTAVTSRQPPPGNAALKSTAPAPGWPSAIAFTVFSLALVGGLQFYFARVPSDADTAYHAAVGRLIAEHGILRAFPWTSVSWLADHYADKELLFHLMFVPLSALSWITASKVVGTLTGAAVLITIYAILRAEGIRFPAAWAVLPLAASSAFLYRFLLVRPHLLSLALSVVVLWAAVRGRLWLLGIASFLYPWAYVGWILPVGLATVAEAARRLGGQEFNWKTVAVAIGAVALGVAVHPNAGNLVHFTWLQIGGALVANAWGKRAGLEMGTEFEAFSPTQWAGLLLLAFAMALLGMVLSWRHRRTSPVALAFALAAACFGLATARTARFAEYFVPFSVLALALSLNALGSRRLQFAPWGLLSVALLYQGWEESSLLARLREWPNRIPSYAAKTMQAGIPVGAQVFTCEWGMTGYLLQALPDRRFLVALDPTFFQAKDPELYSLWYVATRRPPPGVATLVRERFGARYVACFYDPQFEPFTAQLASTPGVRTILISDDWNVFDLGPP
jgi:hypothetical protein